MKTQKLTTRFILSIVLLFSLSFNLETFAQDHPKNDDESCNKRFPNAIHLDRDEIMDLTLGDDLNGIASLLALKTGITFRNTGDPGAETWFIVRNYGRDNSRMTLILVDGRPLNLATNHTLEFDDIPISIIESITIYPGPVPVEYGGYQSVVEINTIQNKDFAYASASMGNYGSYRTSAGLGKTGRLHYMANFDLDMGLGQSNQKLSGLMEDFRYSNREYRTVLPSLKLGYEIHEDVDITLQANFVDFKKMFATDTLFGQEASRVRNMQNYSATIQPGRNSNMDYRIVAYTNIEEETLNALMPEDPTYDMKWGKQNRRIMGARAHYAHSVNDWLKLRTGGEFHFSEGKIDNEEYLYFKYIDEQNYYGAFLQAELTAWEGGYLNLGARIDGQKDIDDIYISPVFGAYQNLLDQTLQIYATYGVSSRWIPLNEVNTFVRPGRILGPPFLQGNVVMPQPELAMERMTSIDVGTRISLLDGKINTRINYFYMSNEGQTLVPSIIIAPTIEDAPVPPGFNSAFVMFDQNFPGYDVSQGIEFEVSAKPMDNLRIFVNATYFLESETRVYDDVDIYEGPMGGPDAQEIMYNSIGHQFLAYHGKAIIPGAYDLLANAGITYNPTSRSAINLLARYRGVTEDPIMKFGIDPQVENIPSSLIFDIALGYDVHSTETYNIRAFMSVNNILDTDYQTFVHYPMPGRYISGGFRFNIK